MRVRNLIVLLSLLWALPVEAQLVRFPSIEIGTVSVGCRYQSLNVGDDNPNGDVTGSICDVVIETTTGAVWTKTSGTATTSGWVALTSSATTGTVTSVALTAPGIFSVSGSPITASGTLALSLANQNANVVFAGPATGSATAPAFRKIVFGDWATNSCASGQIPKFDGADWVCDDDAGASTGAPADVQYVTLATDATLTNERVLTAGDEIDLTDAGANGAITVSLEGTLNSKTLATPTVTGAITLPDGVTQVFNPDATNAGINVGAVAGDPSSADNGDLWYDSGSNELTARINGSNVALGAGGGGSPGGSSGDLQINDGSSGFDPYAGDGCSPGDFVTDIASDGTVTCDTPVGGGGGGLVLLEQHTASSSASLDFTTCISSTYDEYQIEFVGIVPATDNTNLYMRMSTNGGSTYDSSSIYGHAVFVWRAGATGAQGAEGGSNHINLTSFGVSNASTNGIVGHVRFSSPLSTALHKYLVGELTFNDTGFRLGAVTRASYESVTAVDAFQFFMNSGNIASGTIRCYGVEK